jgi:uncharacterized RDD family membrane protein YckC
MNFTHRQFEYAGFLRRSMAFIIDSTLFSLISSALALSIFGSEYPLLSQQASLANLLDWRLLIFDHGLPALFVISFWIVWMATPGKLLLDCRIVDASTKEKAHTSQLIIRYLAYLVSTIPLGLGFIWILFDKHNQGWHDKLSKTLVIMQDESLQTLEAYR